MTKYNLKLFTLLLIIILPAFFLLITGPIDQTISYHNFADKRSFWGINNFFDVISNLGFFIMGLLGLNQIRYIKIYRWSWITFYLGVILVSFGSAYYHLNPINETLVWDRIPITIGFMGIFVGIISEIFKIKYEKVLLIALVAFGIFSVFYWQAYSDLRPYIWVQFTPIIALLYCAFAYPSDYINKKLILLSIFFYMLAKVTEVYDESIFIISKNTISGHTLKHLLATVAIFFLYSLKKFALKARQKL